MAGQRFVGVDVGTSAVRACVIDEREAVLAETRVALPPPRREGAMLEQAPQVWRDAMQQALRRLAPTLASAEGVQLALDGTSGSVLVVDDAGQPLAPVCCMRMPGRRPRQRASARSAPSTRRAPGRCRAPARGWPRRFG
jgi:Sugar (pentulose and hexulose) kinases